MAAAVLPYSPASLPDLPSQEGRAADRPATKVSRRRPTPGPARVPSPDAPVRERRPRGGLVHAQPAGARPRLTTSHPFAALRTPPAGCEEAKGVRSRGGWGTTDRWGAW